MKQYYDGQIKEDVIREAYDLRGRWEMLIKCNQVNATGHEHWNYFHETKVKLSLCLTKHHASTAKSGELL
jgi:hypothetical protein